MSQYSNMINYQSHRQERPGVVKLSQFIQAIDVISSDDQNDPKLQVGSGKCRHTASIPNSSFKTMRKYIKAVARLHYYIGVRDIEHFLHLKDIVTCDVHLLE